MNRITIREFAILAAGLMVTFLLGGLMWAKHMPLENRGWAKPSLGWQAEDENNWIAVHFLSDDCGCSERVERWVKSLVSADSVEHWLARKSGEVWIARHASTGQQRALGLEEKIRVAPWLILADKHGRVRYAGGYDAPPVYASNILREVRAAEHGDTEVKRRGVRGCSTNPGLSLSGIQLPGFKGVRWNVQF
ncbi:MAG: hypothetical protein OHK0021_14900 [Bryobacter sp.]